MPDDTPSSNPLNLAIIDRQERASSSAYRRGGTRVRGQDAPSRASVRVLGGDPYATVRVVDSSVDPDAPPPYVDPWWAAHGPDLPEPQPDPEPEPPPDLAAIEASRVQEREARYARRRARLRARRAGSVSTAPVEPEPEPQPEPEPECSGVDDGQACA